MCALRGAQGYREVYDVLHPRQQNEQARGLRTTPFYERQHASARTSSRAPAGSGRSGTRPTRELLTGDGPAARRVGGALLVADRRRPSTAPAASGSASSTSRRSPRSRSSGPGRARLPAAPGRQRRRQAGGHDRLHGDALAARRDHVRPDDHAPRRGRFWVVTGGAVGRHDIAWMRRHLPDDGSVLLDRPDLVAVLPGRLGPAARDLVGARQRRRPLQRGAPLHARRDAPHRPVPCRALRVSYVGELGWEIYAPTEFGRALWDTLWEAGAPLGAVACGGAPTTRCGWRRATGSGARPAS